MQLAVPQKHLSAFGLLACVMIIYIITILSIDMYVPALPGMQRSFGVTPAYLNLTMFVYFVAATICILLAGFLADRFGRKRIILFACVSFTLSSAGCALAPSVELLVLFRCGQALGYGFVATAATALIKDAFRDDDLRFAMTAIQSLIVLGPAVAPFLGSLMLETTGWRGIFWLLTVLGGLCTVLALLITETYQASDAHHGQGLGAGLRLMAGKSRELFSDRAFTALTLFFSVAAIPYFAFIAVASYILLDTFATGYLNYSFCYAAVCLVSIAAPYLYMALSKRVFPKWIMVLCILLIAVSAAGMFGVGQIGPIVFVALVSLYALSEGIARPLAFVELLQQRDELVGTASSLANFVYGIATALGTVLATLDWPNYIFGIAVLLAGTAAAMALLYLWGLRGSE